MEREEKLIELFEVKKVNYLIELLLSLIRKC